MSVLDIFFKKKSSFNRQAWYKAIKNISKVSHDINNSKTKLDDSVYTVLQQNKEDMFISVADFIELLTADDMSMDMILGKCKHLTELVNNNYSVVEVYPIVEDDHIVLCSDIDRCPKHSDYKGDKIKIVSVRK